MDQVTTPNAQQAPIADDIKIPNAPQSPEVGGGNELLDVNFILRETVAIQPGQIVADLGAGGAAYFTMQAAKIVGDQGEVYAVDVVKNTLSSIEGKARMAGLYNIKTIWSNLEILGATKIPAETLDHALLINILFQAQKKADILAEAIRLLKPGGRLTIVDWSDTKPSFAPSAEMQVDQNELLSIAEKLNLQLEQQFKAGNYHFGLIFIK
ncbi:class I SAM-dependent methyltransferase [bacterium]|nr:class I SAM-dependent methyltransferase [bacterium]MBT4649091.1 class I SAM-dependent methyltransferase [bacterium]